jgi:hypothetical protein
MKTLVIHPIDRSTAFLSPIYADLKCTVLNEGTHTKKELIEVIEAHDRIIMMGHGSPMGLFNTGSFPKMMGYVIDDTMAQVLKGKECIAIWCNADRYMEFHELKGFYSGMFISEYGEARYCRVPNPTQELVTESNETFAEIMAVHINLPIAELSDKVREFYMNYAAENKNSSAQYNANRLYLVE